MTYTSTNSFEKRQCCTGTNEQFYKLIKPLLLTLKNDIEEVRFESKSVLLNK